MSVQTLYSKNTEIALAGLVADIGPYEINTFINETGIILFGFGVGRGTEEEHAVLGIGSRFLGIATRQTAKENTIVGGEETQYNETETMAVIREGNVWCSFIVGGVAGETVVVNDVTGAIDVGPGGGGTTLIGTLETDTIAGELGLVRLTD